MYSKINQMTEQTTIDTKTIIKQHVEEQKRKVQFLADKFKKEKNDIKDTHFKFLADLKKYCDLFEITETPSKKTFTVTANKLNPDGTFDDNVYFPIAEITVDYSTYRIDIPSSKLPKKFPTVNIEIEEHVTYSIRGWRGTNHGTKIAFTLGWGDKKYYKTGRVIAEKIYQEIALINDKEDRAKKSEEFNKKCEDYMNTNFGKNSWSCESKGNIYRVVLPNEVNFTVRINKINWEIESSQILNIDFPKSKFDTKTVLEILKSV